MTHVITLVEALAEQSQRLAEQLERLMEAKAKRHAEMRQALEEVKAAANKAIDEITNA